MTLTQLAYAVAVDTYRHFGQAAEHCCVSQPTLSMQLQKLEDELGVQLFDRSRKPVLPTDVGREVVAQARVVLREADRLGELLADREGPLTGELRLGVLPTLSPYLLPLVAARFAARHPAVTVRVSELTTDRLLDLLATDRLDAGLIATDEQRPGLTLRPLFAEPFVAYVGEAHPLARARRIDPEALRVEDLWLLSEGHCFRDQVLQVCGAEAEADGPRSLQFESGSLETLRLMVDRVGGVTLLPLLATEALGEDALARVRPFRAPVPQRQVRLAVGRAYLKRALIDAYAAVVREAVEPVLPAA